jgi:hypothetical protein
MSDQLISEDKLQPIRPPTIVLQGILANDFKRYDGLIPGMKVSLVNYNARVEPI